MLASNVLGGSQFPFIREVKGVLHGKFFLAASVPHGAGEQCAGWASVSFYKRGRGCSSWKVFI